MWKCPICKREFKNTNQQHYCGEPINTVEAYIEAQDELVRPILEQVRNTIRNTLPNTKECISWGMPTFKGKHNIIHFAANKKHLGLYPGEKAIDILRIVCQSTRQVRVQSSFRTISRCLWI